MWIGFAMLKMLHLLVGCRVLPPLLTILQNEYFPVFVASESTLIQKQYRKLILEIVTFRAIHEPNKYLNLFHLYAHNIPINRNLIV